MKSFTVLTILLFLLCHSTVLAQKTPCQQDPAYQAFDFWLGHWDVHDKDGKFQGTNLIEKTADGCLIREQWTSAQGNQGFSINYYNPVTKVWAQKWVSYGSVIEYTGVIEKAGSLQLVGTIYYQQNKTQAPFRGTWTLLEDGKVRQLFEQQDPASNQWNTWFDGYYTLKKN